MGKPIVWMNMAADRAFTEAEREAIDDIMSVGDEDGDPLVTDEAGCEGNFVFCGWCFHDEAEKVRKKIVESMPDISWRVDLQWGECDAPGEEILYFGPKALELELHDVDEACIELEQRWTYLNAAIAARDAAKQNA